MTSSPPAAIGVRFISVKSLCERVWALYAFWCMCHHFSKKKTKLIHVCMYMESKSVGPYKSRGTFGIIVSGLVWYLITRFIAGRLCPPSLV